MGRTLKKAWNIGCFAILGLLVIAVLVGVFAVGKSCGLITVKPSIERSLPEHTGVLYEVQTTSRRYYAERVIETEESVTIENYYEFTNRKWRFVDRAFPMLRETYGEIKIIPPSPSP